MTTAQAPVRAYKFTDARLIELCLEKIAFAERDATELLTVGVTAVWVSDFETRVLTFGAMPTDTIELGEQKEATEEKEVDADMVKDKLKELRSAAKRALGEKSNDYGQFGFINLDNFKDSDLLKIALVVPALTTKHAVILATKGWLAADNTELNTLLTTFVSGIQNQVLEIGSRDSAAAVRVNEGNEVFNLLNNELCEAGKGYWRTISEAKYNDYLLFNTESGSGLSNVVVEGFAPFGISDIEVPPFTPTDSTTMQLEISAPVQVSYGPALGPPMGATVWFPTPPLQNKTFEAYAALTGYSIINTFLKFQNNNTHFPCSER